MELKALLISLKVHVKDFKTLNCMIYDCVSSNILGLMEIVFNASFVKLLSFVWTVVQSDYWFTRRPIILTLKYII